MAAEMGNPFMPHQQLVADVAGELVTNESGLLVPAYTEVIVTMMRQNGKTALVWAAVAERSLMWGRPSRVAYTAQTGLDGRQKFVQEIWPDWFQHSGLAPMVKRTYQASDNTGMVWKNGSRVSVLSVGEESGHGKTLDMAVIDEAFADEDDRREQALLPTMATRPTAQLWNTSTAGTDKSLYLQRKMEIGRAAVTEGLRSGVAYFEWSIPDDEDIDSPDVWARYIPALGRTISVDRLRYFRQTMKENEFRRAYGNQWTTADEGWTVIGREAWNAVKSSESPGGRLTFAVDVNPDRTAGAIAACDESGRVELVAHGDGTSWMRQTVGELSRKWNAPIVVDSLGPAGYLIDQLQADQVEVIAYNTTAYARACGKFYDHVYDERAKITGTAESLDLAVEHSRRRPIGDQWVWARKDTSADISPLVAVTLAYSQAVDDADGEVTVTFL